MLRWRVQTCRPVLVGCQPGSALPPGRAGRRARRGAGRRARAGADQKQEAPVILSVLVISNIVCEDGNLKNKDRIFHFHITPPDREAVFPAFVISDDQTGRPVNKQSGPVLGSAGGEPPLGNPSRCREHHPVTAQFRLVLSCLVATVGPTQQSSWI